MMPMYNTILLTDIYNDIDSFIVDYRNSPIHIDMTEESARALFFLIYARYGNNPIANNSPDAFKLKLLATFYQFGPTWAKRVDIQKALRNLSEDELRTGNKTIMNTALNPETSPSSADLQELTYINSQNTSNNKKSILNAYADLWDVLKVDVTELVLDKFKHLFKTIVIPEHTLIYTTEDDE